MAMYDEGANMRNTGLSPFSDPAQNQTLAELALENMARDSGANVRPLTLAELARDMLDLHEEFRDTKRYFRRKDERQQRMIYLLSAIIALLNAVLWFEKYRSGHL